MALNLTVLMSTFNGERYIAEAIQSVLDQTFADFEFIIIDDGSTDSTSSIINSFNDKRILYFKKETNTGLADSLNLGITKARGQFIARMDDDDVCLPIRFEKQLEFLMDNKDFIFCGSNVTGNNGQPLRTPEHHDDICLELLFRNPIFHPTAMIRKDVLLAEPYNIHSVPSEDYDLWSRIIFKGKFYQYQEPLLYCRVHKESVTMNRRKEQLLKNVAIATNMFNKHGFISELCDKDYIRIFASYDYSISGKRLSGLINWFNNLKHKNDLKKVFPETKFNNMANNHLERFIISYFMNRTTFKKIIPFLSLDFKHQVIIMNYYFKKLF